MRLNSWREPRLDDERKNFCHVEISGRDEIECRIHKIRMCVLNMTVRCVGEMFAFDCDESYNYAHIKLISVCRWLWFHAHCAVTEYFLRITHIHTHENTVSAAIWQHRNSVFYNLYFWFFIASNYLWKIQRYYRVERIRKSQTKTTRFAISGNVVSAEIRARCSNIMHLNDVINES